MIRKFRKSIDKNEWEQTQALYATLVGSIVTCVGLLKGKTIHDNWEEFNKLKKNKKSLPNTVAEIVNYVDALYGDAPLLPCFKQRLVLVYAVNEFYAPMVAIATPEGEIAPISPDGMYYGILGHIGKDWVAVEPVYEF